MARMVPAWISNGGALGELDSEMIVSADLSR